MRHRSWSTIVTVLRELDDDTELEIEVEVYVSPGERQWFNALEGVGHPGCGPEPEVVAARLNGVEVELTDAEIKEAEDHAVEEYADDSRY